MNLGAELNPRSLKGQQINAFSIETIFLSHNRLLPQMSKIKLYEEEIQKLTVSVRLLQEDNRRLTQCQESDEYEKLVEFR